MIDDLKIPNSLKEVKKYINKGYSLLAGGTEINRLSSSVKNNKFVSLSSCSLKKIEKTEDKIFIGSMCTFSDILKSDIIPEKIKEAASCCSSLQLKNMATVGGNIALCRDDSYLIPVLSSFNAMVKVYNTKKLIPLLDFLFCDKEDDIIEGVLIDPSIKVASYRCSSTSSSHALITLSLGKDKKGELFGSAAVKTVGVVDLKDIAHDVKESGSKIDLDMFKSDLLYGSKEYKKYMFNTAIEIVLNDLK